MKKITLFQKIIFCLLFASSSAMAQQFLERSTGFPTAGTYANNLSIANDDVIWVYGGNSSYFSISTDKGNTWNLSQPGLPADLLVIELAARSATTAYIAANDFTNGLNGIYKTTDAGTTWVRQSTAAFDFSSFVNLVHFFDDNNAVVIGDPDDEGHFEIYTTTNGGQNWARVPATALPELIPGEYGVSSRFDAVGDTIWFMSAGSTKRLYKSTNKGLNWTAVSYDNLLPTFYHGFSFADANNGLMYSQDDNALSVYRTVDGGATFTPITFPSDLQVWDVVCIPGTSAAILSGLSGTHYTNDNGSSWRTLPMGGAYSGMKFKNRQTGFSGGVTTSATVGGAFKFVNSISIIGSNVGDVPWNTDALMATTDGIHYALDNQTLPAGELKFRQNLEWSPGSQDWGGLGFPTGIGTNGGPNIPVTANTYDISINILTGAYSFDQSLSIAQSDKTVFAVYPNPAAATLTVQSDEVLTNITILEPAGKKVLEWDRPDAVIDVSGLSSGIYLIKITVAGKTHQTKFIKK